MPHKPETFRPAGQPSPEENRRRYEHERSQTESRKLYDSRWSKASKLFLSQHPLCVECYAIGKRIPSMATDHKVPHRGNKKLFWDKANWQPLCDLCHGRKTRRGE